jgi:hypothetical protein
MEQVFLSVICSSIVVLVTAFALATPAVKSDLPEQTLLLRLPRDESVALLVRLPTRRDALGSHRPRDFTE